jgi:hypothetical protein
MRCISSAFCFLVMTLLIACNDQSSAPETANESVTNTNMDLSALQSRLDTLQVRAHRIKASNDIKRLQRAYGYYLDEALWDELVDLFTEDATVEYAREGLYRGKDRIREYLNVLGGGQLGLSEGQLNEHYQLMPVITLAEDGLSAKGRWRAIILNGEFGEAAMWGEGPYENEYAKEDGVWKISKVRWYQTILVPYEGGWGLNEDINKGIYVSSEFPPDEPQTDNFGSWPETFLPPFHFENPVGRYESPTTDAKGEEL